MLNSRRRFDRSTALLITFVVVSIILMTVDVRGQGVTTSFRETTQAIVEPLQNGANAVVRPIAGFVDGLANLAGLRAENEELRTELSEANRRLAETEPLRSENEELRNLLNLDTLDSIESQIARVQALGTSDFDHSIVIDKGADDGLVVDYPVRNLDGLVGRVVSVSSDSSRVMLLTNPNHAVEVQVVGSEDRGSAKGRGAGDLQFISATAQQEITQGVTLVTDAGRYPAGLLVGRASETAQRQAGFAVQTSITPAVDFTTLDFVEVLFYVPVDPSVQLEPAVEPEPVPLDPAEEES
jgi:rod shape-determining protein MreC